MLHTTRIGDRGTPVVFLHGLFGQGRNWTGIAKGLADHHRVTLVDLPHHGRSSWTAGFDFRETAAMVAELWPASDPVALVGHSLGGKVAMLAALLHPEQVARLCVADVAPVRYDSGPEFLGYISALRSVDLASLERRSQADELLREAVPSATVRAFLLQNLRHDADGWRWQVNLDVLERDMETIGGWPDQLVDGVDPYPGPVLWVAGERSQYVRDEYVPLMGRWFPRHRRVTIKNAGHWVHSEQPQVFLEVLRRFVDSP